MGRVAIHCHDRRTVHCRPIVCSVAAVLLQRECGMRGEVHQRVAPALDLHHHVVEMDEWAFPWTRNTHLPRSGERPILASP